MTIHYHTSKVMINPHILRNAIYVYLQNVFFLYKNCWYINLFFFYIKKKKDDEELQEK